ncbi:hypothetical protein HYW67_03165 [Candidatus Parcubacteria bacterium]|nr:hypothetical protein [Candidatus Parcubacteria bacterium]
MIVLVFLLLVVMAAVLTWRFLSTLDRLMPVGEKGGWHDRLGRRVLRRAGMRRRLRLPAISRWRPVARADARAAAGSGAARPLACASEA